MTISELTTELNTQRAKHGDLCVKFMEQRWSVPYGMTVKKIKYSKRFDCIEVELHGRMERIMADDKVF